MGAILLTLAAALPAAAQTSSGTGKTFQQVVDGGIIPFFDTNVIPLLYALAFLFLVFGVFKYFFTGGQENREVARTYIIWALIGMVVIFGVWGILHIFLSTLNIS